MTNLVFESDWGTFTFETLQEIKAAREALKRYEQACLRKELWQEIFARDIFAAYYDNESIAAIDENAPNCIRAELVFVATYDQRDDNPKYGTAGKWEFSRFKYYEFSGKKYKVRADDFPNEFDMNAVNWDGEPEEHGSEHLIVTATAQVYIMDPAHEFEKRRK